MARLAASLTALTSVPSARRDRQVLVAKCCVRCHAIIACSRRHSDHTGRPLTQQSVEPAAIIASEDFAGIRRAYGRQRVCPTDPGLQEGEAPIKLERRLDGGAIRQCQPSQFPRSKEPLVSQVVIGQDRSRSLIRTRFQQERHQSCMPVVSVHDVRLPALVRRSICDMCCDVV